LSAADVVWEGLVEKVDPALTPTVRMGLVASGSWSWGEAAASQSAAEATLDAHHVLILQAHQRAASESRWVNDDPARKGGDFVEWRTPLVSEPLAGSDYRAAWLVLWLYDREGEMLLSEKPISAVPTWRRGWWQWHFWSETEQRFAVAEGPLLGFGNEGEPLTPSEEIAQLAGIVRTLGSRLSEKENALAAREAEVAALREQLAGSTRRIDFLIAERDRAEARLAAMQAGHDGRVALENDLARTRTQLAEAEAARAQLTETNAKLSAQLAELALQVDAQRAQTPVEMQASLPVVEVDEDRVEPAFTPPILPTVEPVLTEPGSIVILEDSFEAQPLPVAVPVVEEASRAEAPPRVETIVVEQSAKPRKRPGKFRRR